MNDSHSHQLEPGELEELGGAAGQRRTHTPPGPAPRLEAPGGTVGGGAPRLGGPGGWASRLRHGAGSAGASSLIPSAGRAACPSLPSSSLSHPSERSCT